MAASAPTGWQLLRAAHCLLTGRSYRRKIDLVGDFLLTAVNALAPQDRIGLATIGLNYRTDLAPTRDRRALAEALTVVRHGVLHDAEPTSLFPGIADHFAAIALHSAGRAVFIVFITDGGDGDRAAAAAAGQLVRAFATAHPDQRRFLTLAVGQNRSLDYAALGMFGIAAGEQPRLFDSYFEIRAALVRELAPHTAGPPQATSAVVPLGLGEFLHRTRRPPLDLCFLVDRSGSMGQFVSS